MGSLDSQAQKLGNFGQRTKIFQRRKFIDGRNSLNGAHERSLVSKVKIRVADARRRRREIDDVASNERVAHGAVR